MNMDANEKSLIETLISQNAAFAARVSQLESENTDLRIRQEGFHKYFSESARELYRRHANAVYRLQTEIWPKDDLSRTLPRREMTLQLLSSIAGCEPLMKLYPHGGLGERLRVLVMCSGGMGDCVVASHAALLIRSHLAVDWLGLCFEGKIAQEAFAQTALWDEVLSVTGEGREALFAVATAFDLFDLVIDLRYAAVPFFPPLSRVSAPARDVMTSQASRWFRYNVFDWPHLNHQFAIQAQSEGLDAYSLLAASLGLGGAGHTVLDVEPLASDALKSMLALDKPVACVGVGSDPKMANATGGSTKTPSPEQMAQVVAGLQRKGIACAQLGVAHEPAIVGVDLDLRGQLALRETAAVLKAAGCFVGPEGGLVHLAKAVGTRSVVLFGPTPRGFFGYPENENLAAPDCGACWWTSRDWMTNCPSHGANSPCIVSIGVGEIIAGALRLLQPSVPQFELTAHSELDRGNVRPARPAPAPDSRMLIEGGTRFDTVFDRYFEQDAGATWLVRQNFPLLTPFTGDVFIHADDTLPATLAALNASRLAKEGTRLILATRRPDGPAPVSPEQARELAAHLAGAFRTRGQLLQTGARRRDRGSPVFLQLESAGS